MVHRRGIAMVSVTAAASTAGSGGQQHNDASPARQTIVEAAAAVASRSPVTGRATLGGRLRSVALGFSASSCSSQATRKCLLGALIVASAPQSAEAPAGPPAQARQVGFKAFPDGGHPGSNAATQPLPISGVPHELQGRREPRGQF